MGRRPQPLPDELGAQFSVPGAAAIRVGAGRLRRPGLARPCYGARGRGEDDVLGQVRGLATVLDPAAVFSHSTAAMVLKLPLIHIDDQVHVTTPPGTSRVVRQGVVGHRSSISAAMVVDGLRVSDPVTTWADVSVIGGLEQSVVLGDAVVMREGMGVACLADEVERRRGGRGVRTMREAMQLIRVGAQSPMESRARLLMARAGLPEPELNRDVFDATGAWIARPDFSWPERKVAVEYDGDHHRTDRAQWQRDIHRRRALEDAGWRVVVITADDVLRHPERMIALIRAALT
jgi:hypothetical protein